MMQMSRRTLIAGLSVLLADLTRARAVPAFPAIAVSKDPDCGCCAGWVEHLRAEGFDAMVKDVADMPAVKARLGIPPDLASCHTAEIAGYVIEGHVPASAITRLLSEQPDARGLAVPGMPTGSPGMEAPGALDETYEVVLFGPESRRVFGRYRGADVL